jgi:hypothetical protein
MLLLLLLFPLSPLLRSQNIILEIHWIKKIPYDFSEREVRKNVQDMNKFVLYKLKFRTEK